jgi:tricorn protease
MRRLILTVVLMTVVFAHGALADAPRPYLFQHPSVSATRIAFAWAGQIWSVPREGGAAQRLVAGSGRLSDPLFSPDGSMVAFSGDYDGNVDVYVVPSSGGQPRRLTWHPGDDTVLAWTPDGKRVAFRSPRQSVRDPQQMYTVAIEGGPASEVPLPRVEEASYSPDGSHVAYQPNFQWQPAWKGYRGGQTRTVWLADLADSSIVRIPQENNSNDANPMWVGDRVYFLSDRRGSIALYSYDVKSKSVAAVVPNDGLDIVSASASASAGAGAIVYTKPGSLHLVDLATGASRAVPVEIEADLPQLMPRFEKVDPAGIASAAISPTGQRAVFEAHGELVTAPVEKGDLRNISGTTGAMERDPAWSPDGTSIAAFSDESGEYALTIRNQNGLGEVRRIPLPPTFYYRPLWSPDNKRIAFSDKKLNLWYVDVASGKTQLVDTDLNDSPARSFDPSWSPDSRWLAYTKLMSNQQHVAWVYSIDSRKATQVTDTLSDARFPQFDAGGKYLYFTASTDLGLGAGWLDMSSIGRPQSRSVYAAVLRKGEPSPVPLQSDEEKTAGTPSDPKKDDKKDESKADPKKDEKKPEAVEVRIDFDGLGQRIVSLPIPARNYSGLVAGKTGQLFLMELPIVVISDEPVIPFDVSRFDLDKRKIEPLLKGVSQFAVSANGEKMLYRAGPAWSITGTDKAPSGGEGALAALAGLTVSIDPAAEWKQMYREVWRIERDFLYDPGFHGLDIAAAEKAYAPFLAGVGGRDDLNYLFREMTGNISVGHTFVQAGLRPPVTAVMVGLLGADYAIDNGRYRFARVFNGENWNPNLLAPLTAPGVEVKEGEYLLAVNGRDVRASNDVYSYFLGTAGVQTAIRVGPKPDGSGARDVTVVPVPDEQRLRNLAWIEDNRRKVDQLSGGRVAYVWLPDTANGGYTNFNRWFLAQAGKEGAVVDERFNHGGLLSDYIIEVLGRKPMGRVMGREGEDYTEPVAAIFGPKAMVINQFAGSGGDALPWYFKRNGLGTLVGTRTWGGLVGIGNYPVLMDGGLITAPRWALYGLQGQFEVENIGISPDVEVEQDPKLVREGHDPQLERAVAVVLEQLKANPPQSFPRPPYPVFRHPLPTWP